MSGEEIVSDSNTAANQSNLLKASVTGYTYHPTDFYQVTVDLDINK